MASPSPGTCLVLLCLIFRIPLHALCFGSALEAAGKEVSERVPAGAGWGWLQASSLCLALQLPAWSPETCNFHSRVLDCSFYCPLVIEATLSVYLFFATKISLNKPPLFS